MDPMKAALISFLILPLMAFAQDPLLSRITEEFDRRESAGDSVEAHRLWLGTPEGKMDVSYLAENFEKLHVLRQDEIPKELARTGKAVVVPLLQQSLSKSRSAIPGVYYACFFKEIEPEFGKRVAPLILPWIAEGKAIGNDTAIDVLPLLDAEFAAKTFFSDEYLNPASPLAHMVLSSCNKAGLKVPAIYLDRLLAAWEPNLPNANMENRIARGIRESVMALARHDPPRALAKADEIIQTRPEWAEDLAEIHLLAAGLIGLYDKLAALSDDDPDRFEKLPLPTRQYFAILYFKSDCENGGIEQALDNSTGDYLPLVRSGYEAIGDQRSLAWLDWMCKPFGPAGPSSNRKERIRQMEAMKTAYHEQVDQLGEDWEKRHPRDAKEVSTRWKLAKYVSKHADEILKALDP